MDEDDIEQLDNRDNWMRWFLYQKPFNLPRRSEEVVDIGDVDKENRIMWN